MEQKLVTKKVAVIPFPGGRLEVSNAYDYFSEKQNAYVKARSGVFLCVPGSYPIDVSELDFADLANKLAKNKKAQEIIKENRAALE